MGLLLKIPHEDGHMVDVEIMEDLSMVFYDYDISYDLGSREFGYPTTFCAAAFDLWDTHPMTFICSSGLIPIRSLGVVSCRLAQEALTIVRSHEEFDCYDEAGKLIKASLKNWNPKRAAIQELHTSIQQLVKCWNKVVSSRRDHEWQSQMPSFSAQKIVDATIACAAFVISFWNAMEYTGGFTSYPSHPCDIVQAIQLAVAYVLYKPILEERNRFFGTKFEDLLEKKPSDLVALLNNIEKDQAVLAVKIIGALP